jgi:hypothetical protein
MMRPTGSLHFTIGVLSLPNQEAMDRALGVLHSCHPQVFPATEGRNVTVSLKGIESMQRDITKLSVVYAVPTEGDGRLRQLASTIIFVVAD